MRPITQHVKTGEVYGNLKVIRFSHRKNNGRYFLCLCVCGKEKAIYSCNLVNRKSKSCGCRPQQILPDNGAILRDAFRTHKAHANSRGIASFLSLQEYRSIAIRPCRYCSGFSVRKNKKLKTEVNLNSVDRLNNEPFYKIENSVPACFVCQKMKWDMKEADFLEKVRKIVETCCRMETQ